MFVDSVGEAFRQAQWGRHVSVCGCLDLNWKDVKAGVTQHLEAWMIWKLLHSEVSLNPGRLER